MYITQKEMQIRVIVVCLFVGWGGRVGNDDRHCIRGFLGEASQRKVTTFSGFSELNIPPAQNKM